MRIQTPAPPKLLRVLLVFFAAQCVSACSEAPRYPEGWPEPESSRSSRKGDCPDLSGNYDGARSELPWLLGVDASPEASPTPGYEHRVNITQAEDGSWLQTTLDLNEHGLPEFREYMIRHNLDGRDMKMVVGRRTLRREAGRDYRCRDGWLESLHWPQQEPAHGWQRKRLAFGRDASGNLIAAATIVRESTFSWGGGPGIRLGRHDDTQWYRWPTRASFKDELLHEKYSLDVHRYRWTNGGGSVVPVRITNFQPVPVCVYVVTVPSTRHVQPVVPGRGQCAAHETRLVFGGVMYTGLTVPDAAGTIHRVEWRDADAPYEGGRQSIVVRDATALPTMPEPSPRGTAPTKSG